jgi:hypothetical protein
MQYQHDGVDRIARVVAAEILYMLLKKMAAAVSDRRCDGDDATTNHMQLCMVYMFHLRSLGGDESNRRGSELCDAVASLEPKLTSSDGKVW